MPVVRLLSAFTIFAFGIAAAAQENVPEFGTTVYLPTGLRGRVYLIPPTTSVLPDFNKLSPVGTIYTPRLYVPPEDFQAGFPGVTNRFEWFAIDYTGGFWIEEPGSYRFVLISDDGAKLYIDNRLIADDDGLHPPEARLGKCKLKKGSHWMRVSYFQGPRYQLALVLLVARPRQRHFQVFDTRNFTSPPADVAK